MPHAPWDCSESIDYALHGLRQYLRVEVDQQFLLKGNRNMLLTRAKVKCQLEEC